MNKLFSIRAAGDDQKMQIRLWFVVLIALASTLGTFEVYLQITGEHIDSFRRLQFIFFIPILQAVVGIAPTVIKIIWKKIIIQTMLGTIFGTVLFLVMFRIIL